MGEAAADFAQRQVPPRPGPVAQRTEEVLVVETDAQRGQVSGRQSSVVDRSKKTTLVPLFGVSPGPAGLLLTRRRRRRSFARAGRGCGRVSPSTSCAPVFAPS